MTLNTDWPKSDAQLYYKKDQFTPPGFIVGVPRSGTTLLSAILNRHPNICVTPETEFFLNVDRYCGGFDSFQKQWPKSVLTVLEKMPKTSEWANISREFLTRLDVNRANIKTAFCDLGSVIARSKGKSLWIEKTPRHLRFVTKIRELFPDAPILHIIRDGRDVAYSLVSVPWASNSYVQNLYSWREDIRKAHDFLVTDEGTLNIYYEELVEHPESIVENICNFLGVTYFPCLLEPDGSEKDLIEISGQHKTQVLEAISSEKVSKWKAWATPDDVLLGDFVAGRELKLWKYETDQPITSETRCLWVTRGVFMSMERDVFFQRILLAYARVSANHELGGVTSGVFDGARMTMGSVVMTDEDPLRLFSAMQKKSLVKIPYLGLAILFFRTRAALRVVSENSISLVWVCRETLSNVEKWWGKRLFCRLFAKKACFVVLSVGEINVIQKWARVLKVSEDKMSYAGDTSLEKDFLVHIQSCRKEIGLH
jgi:LPS sulfotransferase NodH